MQEYRETEQDRKDAATLAKLDQAAGAIAIARSALTGEDGVWQSLDALTKDEERIIERRAFIVRQGEQRIAAFYADRERVKRAAKALRRDGFIVSFTESQDGSVSDKLGAGQETEPGVVGYAYTTRRQYAYAFEVPYTAGWRGGAGEQGTELTHSLYLSWGPIEGDEDDVLAVGSTIAYAFSDEGLNVEWDGNGHNCVRLHPAGETE